MDETLANLLKDVRYNVDSQLVLADYLQSKNDPRGEMLILDIAFSQGDSSADLAKQRKKLWTHHGKEWEREFAQKNRQFNVLSWYGGRPYNVQLKPDYHAFAEDIDKLIQSEPFLRGVNLPCGDVGYTLIHPLDQMVRLSRFGLRFANLEEVYLGTMYDHHNRDGEYITGTAACKNTEGFVKITELDEASLLQYFYYGSELLDYPAISASNELYSIISELAIFSDEVSFGYPDLRYEEAKSNPFWKTVLSDKMRDKIIKQEFRKNQRCVGGDVAMGIFFPRSEIFNSPALSLLAVSYERGNGLVVCGPWEKQYLAGIVPEDYEGPNNG